MHLITADELSLAAFTEMLDDYAANGTPFLQITDPEIFPYFVRTCVKHSTGFGLSLTTSPYTRYFLVDDDGHIFAQGDVRHKPTKENVMFKGQLGYGVLPSKRGCGYGKLMCALLLEKCKEKGFNEVIITCRDDNIASAKIIEHNGGKFQNTVFDKKNDVFLRRYLVNLSKYTK